ncbi:hypothetical protein [Chitinophaga sp. 22620]|uniref:hypothetical protein n=1 Tax=Chitinophaga sp. 22620 TaxID=3453952 RepID=UPI003F837967
MKNYIIFSVLIIIGLTLLLLQTKALPNSFWYNTLGNVSNTMLVGGTLSLLYNLLIKKDDENNLMQMLRISFSVHDSGLKQILTNSADYRFSDLLGSAELFVAVMNDGLRWIGNHSPDIEQRFNRKGSMTEFFFVDPQGVFCDPLAKKTDVTLAHLQQKIDQTISLINSTYDRSQKQGSLRVYYLKNYPTQSIFLTEDRIIVTPYQIASGRNIIPLFEYEYKVGNKSIGYHISNDIENVRRESQLIVDKRGV